MGGNALSHTSVRLTRKNYQRVADDCVSKLRAIFPGKRICAIESYRAKEDFGDLDILIESDGYDPTEAAQALGAVEVVRNGPVTSVGVVVRPELDCLDGNVFQIDLVTIEPQAFDFASCYFRFSDMGNLVGRIAHAMSTSLRHDGLVFHLRDGDYKFRDIVLTRNYGDALVFLGYDADRYSDGYEDLEDIFEYVASTPFFNKDIYLLNNRNAQARVRDRKRPTYTAFLKWCEAQTDRSEFKFPVDKTSWLPRMFAFFPSFRDEYDLALIDLARQREVKARFNGALVSRVTGLQGKALGLLMRDFKESFESTVAMQEFILANDEAAVTSRVNNVLAR